MMHQILGLLILVLVLPVFVVTKQHRSNLTMNWMDAVRFCGDNKMVLRNSELGHEELKFGKYWTRKYRRESDLMHLYGCVNDKNVITAEPMTIKECLENCSHYEHHLFAVNAAGCYCVNVSADYQNLNGSCHLKNSTFIFGTYDILSGGKKCAKFCCHDKEEIHFQFAACDTAGADVICGQKKVISENLTLNIVAERCYEMNGNRGLNLENICSNDDIKDIYWFGFDTFEYSDEYTNYGVTDVNPKKCFSCEIICKMDDCEEKRIAACEDIMKSVKVTITKDLTYLRTKYTPYRTTKYTQHRTTKYTAHRTTKYTPYKTTKYTQYITKKYTPHRTTKYTPYRTTKYTQHRTTKYTYTPHRATKYTPYRTTTYTQYRTTKYTPHRTTKYTQYRTTKDTLYRTTYTQYRPTEGMSGGTTKNLMFTTENDTSHIAADKYEAVNMVTIYWVTILLPVLSLILLCLVLLRCRYQKRQTLKNTSGIPDNPPTENMAMETGFYELADNSKLDISVPNHTVIKTTDANAVKEDGGTDGSIGGETNPTMTYTKEVVYNHLWEKPAGSSLEKENIYNQCNSRREEISKYGVTGGPHSDSATVNSNYDHVTLVSAKI